MCFGFCDVRSNGFRPSGIDADGPESLLESSLRQRPATVNDHDVDIFARHGRFPCLASPALDKDLRTEPRRRLDLPLCFANFCVWGRVSDLEVNRTAPTNELTRIASGIGGEPVRAASLCETNVIAARCDV